MVMNQMMNCRRLMDSFHQWKAKAQERKFFRALTGAAYELRYVHLGRQVLAAFREVVHGGKQVQALPPWLQMLSSCRAYRTSATLPLRHVQILTATPCRLLHASAGATMV